MTVVRLQDKLEERRAAIAEEYADLIGRPMKTGKPMSEREKAYWREVRALHRAGYRAPLTGLYVVAAFEGEAKNKLQEFGRRLYYRNPSRYHALLPWLGKLAAGRPNEPRPGRQPGPHPTGPR